MNVPLGALVLWVINVVLFLLVFVQALWTLRGRRPAIQDRRRRWLAEGLRRLSSRPSADQLVAALEPPIGRLWAHGEPSLIDGVMALQAAGETDLAAIRAIAERTVNSVNRFAELVEAGLVRPKDLVSEHRDQHLELLKELTLVEPFVWYESLVCDRGRWGFRPLRLRQALLMLRCDSHLPAIRSTIAVGTADGGTLVLLPRLSAWRRPLVRVLNRFRSCTITRRTKIRQRRQRARVREELVRRDVVRPHDVRPW